MIHIPRIVLGERPPFLSSLPDNRFCLRNSSTAFCVIVVHLTSSKYGMICESIHCRYLRYVYSLTSGSFSASHILTASMKHPFLWGIYAFRIACVRFSFASLYVSPYTDRYFVFPVVTSFPRGYLASQRPSSRRKILSPHLPTVEPPF